MNRILFEPCEVKDGIAVFGGDRAAHVLDVLHGEPGQILKTGVLNGRAGTSEILSVAKDGATGERTVAVRVNHCEESLPPSFDLILAPPRPRVMKRLLPQLASLGAGRIVLVGARKVEKDFWGATLLKPENYRPLLVDGLMQAGTTPVPEILARRSLRAFLDEELETLFPSRKRIIAHPYLEGAPVPQPLPEEGRLLLAVGPEGGWTDDEVARFEARGFARHSLGARILRTDTALIALIATLAP